MNNDTFTSGTLPDLKFDKKRTRIKECPCGKDNKDGKFVPYVGFENKGYCHSCGDTFLPELPGSDKWIAPLQTLRRMPRVKSAPPVDVIPFSIYQKQLNNGIHLYNQNHFIQWLGNPIRGNAAFGSKTIQMLIEKYYLGNSGLEKYKGWVLFPYIDIDGRLRDIKAMDYDPAIGKRIKEPYNKVLFLGKEILNNPDANTVRCFYGEHLLKDDLLPVKIFESEATATYAAAFFPNSICLATGGTNGCKWTEKDKCKVLQGRHVTLYPDIDAHESWEQKAILLSQYGLKVQVSQLIKQQAINFSEQSGIAYNDLVKQKFDLRDILKLKNLKNFKATLPCKIPVINDPFVTIEEKDTGLKFNNVIIASIKTQSGRQLICLFDKNGNAVTELDPSIKELAEMYQLNISFMVLNGDTYLCG